jgi:hypothetical protein
LKFQEVVEECGNRWSKPYVATVKLHSLNELHRMFEKGVNMLDMDASCLENLADLITDNVINEGFLHSECKEKVY